MLARGGFTSPICLQRRQAGLVRASSASQVCIYVCHQVGVTSRQSNCNLRLVRYPCRHSQVPWPTPTAIVRDRVTSFEGLKGENFRHPLDQQNTSMLRSIPGLEVIAKSFLGGSKSEAHVCVQSMRDRHVLKLECESSLHLQ